MNFLVSLSLTGYVIILSTIYRVFLFLFRLLPLIDSDSCIVDLIVPALCKCTYAIHIPSYRERPVTGYQLTRLGCFCF